MNQSPHIQAVSFDFVLIMIEIEHFIYLNSLRVPWHSLKALRWKPQNNSNALLSPEIFSHFIYIIEKSVRELYFRKQQYYKKYYTFCRNVCVNLPNDLKEAVWYRSEK